MYLEVGAAISPKKPFPSVEIVRPLTITVVSMSNLPGLKAVQLENLWERFFGFRPSKLARIPRMIIMPNGHTALS
jgi:hypothetical protein